MRYSFVFALLGCFLSNTLTAQQLLINEVSQGPSGAKEYVEFIVAGTPTCTTPVPCLDMRGIVIDDNNGYFAAGSGTGTATGAIRFSNTAFWSCIPQGTIIVIYNNTDMHPAMPAQDASMTDGNCRLVLPANSNLLEGTVVGPTSSNSSYPPSVDWSAGSGTWSMLGMANTGDSFQIRSSITDPTPNHSVSWGNNSSNNQIYFPTASGLVFSFTNQTNDDFLLQGNWVAGTTGTSAETPGVANSSQNAAWISSMNPQCGVVTSIQATLTPTNPTCSGACSGTIQTTVSGGTTPYTYLWSNGATTANLSNLCAGTYTLTISDAGGCTFTDQVTLTNGSGINVQGSKTDESCPNACDGVANSTVTGGTTPYTYNWSNGVNTATNSGLCPGNYTLLVSDNNGCTGNIAVTINPGTPTTTPILQSAGPFQNTDNTVQLQATPSGGTWVGSCGNCVSSSGIFNPQTVSPGSYTFCYTIGTGACSANDCITVQVNQGCQGDTTATSETKCPESVSNHNGQSFSNPGTYYFDFTDINGCDSTEAFTLSNFQVQDISQTFGLCEGDSVLVFGNWVYFPDLFEEIQIDGNGCEFNRTIIVVGEDCSTLDYNVFVPNTFTPNGDMINDTFEIIVSGGMLEEGYILNRWGEVIKSFSWDDLTWDGKTKQGLPVVEGVYTYIIYTTPANGSREQRSGFVTVIR